MTSDDFADASPSNLSIVAAHPHPDDLGDGQARAKLGLVRSEPPRERRIQAMDHEVAEHLGRLRLGHAGPKQGKDQVSGWNSGTVHAGGPNITFSM